jgi:hypothetical protein
VITQFNALDVQSQHLRLKASNTDMQSEICGSLEHNESPNLRKNQPLLINSNNPFSLTPAFADTPQHLMNDDHFESTNSKDKRDQ